LPNNKSAKKRVLVNEKKALNNASAKSALRTSLKKARVSIASNDENKNAAVNEAVIKLDKAAAKGLIHKNMANRRKSRMAKALNASAANSAGGGAVAAGAASNAGKK